MKDTYIVKTCS